MGRSSVENRGVAQIPVMANTTGIPDARYTEDLADALQSHDFMVTLERQGWVGLAVFGAGATPEELDATFTGSPTLPEIVFPVDVQFVGASLQSAVKTAHSTGTASAVNLTVVADPASATIGTIILNEETPLVIATAGTATVAYAGVDADLERQVIPAGTPIALFGEAVTANTSDAEVYYRVNVAFRTVNQPIAKGS